MAEFTEVETALTYIDSTNRETWVRVGTALKTEFGEQGFEMFDTWSKTAKNYNAGAVKSAWKSFQIGKSNIGYVFNRAKENGFVRQNVKPMSAAEIAERERRNAELAKKAEKERQEKAFEAARMANYIWAKSTTAIPLNHGYLQKKGISDPAVLKSIRYNPRFKTLVIPLKNKGHIVGLQFINADSSKNFNADIEKKGSAITIGNRDDMVNGFFVAEGFATAASIVQATGKPCIMAIDAGNLPIVAENLKTFVSNNNVPVVFCTDKDADGKGEKYAKQAAAILGKQAKVITPDFTETETALWQAKNDGKKPTDFNDLQQIGGVERVASVLSGSLTAVVNPENKLLINVYGSPATGKSYTAENLAAQFRAIGIECELVTEYATELIKAGRQDELKDQVKVTGEQLRREQAAFNHANIVITDSPTRLGIIYAPDEQKAALHDIAEQSDKIPHIDILLRHNHESLATFSMNGRIHGKEESLAIQDELIEMMKGKFPIHHERSIPLEEVINRIGETQEWQNFAEKHNVELTRFSIDMDGTFSGSIESVENDTLLVSQTSELSTMNEEMPKPERSAWGDFPPVVRNGDIGELKNEPEYEQAKAGDIVAAGELVNRLIKRETLEQIQTMIGDRKPIVVAVVAEEATGNNAIPRATAQAIGRELGLSVDTNIRQVNKVARTGKTIDHRLAFQPAFGGEVQQGKDYLIVDDTLAAGGTIASLKGYIENRGGKVVGAMAMTARESSLVLPVTQKMLDNIQRNHGNAMNEFWQKEFGYGIDKLTNGEAGHLRKAENVEQIRTRIANAKAQGGFSVSEQTLPKADIQSPNGETNELTDNEIPRPPQGGFVLPDENRQPEQINPKENPMTELNEDKQMLMQMLEANRAVSFRQTAAASELADDEVLRKAFQDTDESVRLAAVRNPNASSEFLQDAFNDAYPNEKAEILNHPNANEELAKEALIYSNEDEVINIAKERLQNQYGWDEERFATAEQERLNNLSRYEQQRLQEEQGELKKSELTAAEPLEKQEWQPDTFTPDTWQPEKETAAEQEVHQETAETQPENPQQQDFEQRLNEINQQQADLQNKLDEWYKQKDALDTLRVQLTAEQLAEIDKKAEEIYKQQAELDQKEATLQIERREVLQKSGVSGSLNERENGIHFDDGDNLTVAKEVETQPYWEQIPAEDKARTAFERLQSNYHLVGQFNPQMITLSLTNPNAKNAEQLHFDPTQERIVLSGVNPQTKQREEIADTHLKDISPEMAAYAVYQDYQAYQQHLLANKAKFPNEEQKQMIDKAGDKAEKVVREAKAKTAKLTPPNAPPETISERYNAVERSFLDTKTNLRLTHRVDYVDSENGKTVLFTDKGSKLTTAKNDPQTAADMVEVAKAKGWTSLKLSGNKEFKRQAWLAAESQGIKTKGYSPSPEDKAMLEKLREQKSLNAMEQGKQKQEKAPEKDERQPEKPQTQETALKGGILLAHGKAPYQHDPKNTDSYYAKVQFADGKEPKTLWGVGIEDAIANSGAKVGDRISLNSTGKETVRLRADMDENGKAIVSNNPNVEEKTFERNLWQVTIHEKAQVPQEQEDLPQERLIKHDLMGQPEKNPAELSQKVDEAIFGKRPDEDASVARDEVEHLKINAHTESSQALNLVSDMPTDNHLLVSDETGERLVTDIHHNGIAGGETPSEVRHAVDRVQTTANAIQTPSVAMFPKGNLKQGKSQNLPYAVQKQQLLAAKEVYKNKAQTLSGQDKVRLKMYQDAVAQTIAREKNDKKMLAWQHYYQYVSARIQDGKLNLPKPIPPEQAKQMMKQLTQSQTQQPKPQMQQPTLSKPRKQKM